MKSNQEEIQGLSGFLVAEQCKEDAIHLGEISSTEHGENNCNHT